MAMQLHPVKNTSEDGEKFKHLSCAYAIIIQYTQPLQSGEYGCGSNDQQQDCEESLNMECDDEYLSEVRVQPKQQCLVLEMGALPHNFYGVCAEMYGTPRDQGTNGFKFTHPMYAKNVERDRADESAEDRKEGCHSKSYGIEHITVYHSTGRVLVQGAPYLFWLPEEFPEIRKACAENAGGASADTKGVCTRDGCSEDCNQLVQCDACDGWVHCHTACSGCRKLSWSPSQLRGRRCLSALNAPRWEMWMEIQWAALRISLSWRPSSKGQKTVHYHVTQNDRRVKSSEW